MTNQSKNSSIPTIIFDPHIVELCPHFRVGIVSFVWDGSCREEALGEAIEQVETSVRLGYTPETWRSRPSIATTRQAYKAFGKDPNRYRPAADQLGRRLINGLGLYRVNPLVDWGNLLSLQMGFSIGVFDRDKIVGDTIQWRLGKADEVYEGIGRGMINIEQMPVYADTLGAFASPTSDSERTKVVANTNNVIIFINDFGTISEFASTDLLAEALHWASESLGSFLGVSEAKQCIQIVYPQKTIE